MADVPRIFEFGNHQPAAGFSEQVTCPSHQSLICQIRANIGAPSITSVDHEIPEGGRPGTGGCAGVLLGLGIRAREPSRSLPVRGEGGHILRRPAPRRDHDVVLWFRSLARMETPPGFSLLCLRPRRARRDAQMEARGLAARLRLPPQRVPGLHLVGDARGFGASLFGRPPLGLRGSVRRHRATSLHGAGSTVR